MSFESLKKFKDQESEFTGCDNGNLNSYRQCSGCGRQVYGFGICECVPTHSFEKMQAYREAQIAQIEQSMDEIVAEEYPDQAPKYTIYTLIDEAFYRLTGRSIYEFDSSLVWATIAIPLIFSLVGLYY